MGVKIWITLNSIKSLEYLFEYQLVFRKDGKTMEKPYSPLLDPIFFF